MEKMNFEYAMTGKVPRRAHVGVVGSGDLEILLEPAKTGNAKVTITTSVDGYVEIWKAVLDRFFANYQRAADIEINDFGATPGTVMLRLEQAVEVSEA